MNYAPVEKLNVSLELFDRELEVGRIALINRRIYFEYAPSFLATGLQISPYKLPLKPGAIASDREFAEGLFGVFNDSLPDGWGRLLLDRQVQARGVAPEKLSPLDRLTHVGKFGMGALRYEPSEPSAAAHHDQLDLDRLADESIQVLEGSAEEIFSELLELSGSSAGARPKVMAGVSADKSKLIHGQQMLPEGFEHWMIKFVSSQDRKDTGTVEYAYSLMARAAGIEMMPTHLFQAAKGIGYFGVKRFDRVGNQRLHMHSLSGLIHSDHRVPSLDYDMVLRATYFVTKNMEEVKKAFRLACFNVFAHNRDDHAKNFTFLMDADGGWRMSPAYDLTYSGGPGGEHCTLIAGEGRVPGVSHLLTLAERFSIPAGEARQIIDQVRTAVSDWKRFAEQAGVKRLTASAIARDIAP